MNFCPRAVSRRLSIVSYLLPPIEDWPDWVNIFDRLEVWRPVVDLICEAQGLEFRSIETPRSNTNAVFILDRRFVVKIYCPFWPEFEFERRLIEVLSDGDSVPVPRIVASGSISDRRDWDYLLLEYSHGRTLEEIRPQLQRSELLGIAGRIGRLVRQLHLTDVRQFESIDAGEDWESLVRRRAHEAPTELVDRRIVAPALGPLLTQFLEAAVADAHSQPRVVVHGDLESDHILFDRVDGHWEVASVIDFGDAKIGVADYEWMPLWFGLFHRDAVAMRAFLDEYNVTLAGDGQFSRRCLAWTLLHDFGTEAVTEVIAKSGAGTQIDSLEWLEEILVPSM